MYRCVYTSEASPAELKLLHEIRAQPALVTPKEEEDSDTELPPKITYNYGTKTIAMLSHLNFSGKLAFDKVWSKHFCVEVTSHVQISEAPADHVACSTRRPRVQGKSESKSKPRTSASRSRSRGDPEADSTEERMQEDLDDIFAQPALSHKYHGITKTVHEAVKTIGATTPTRKRPACSITSPSTPVVKADIQKLANREHSRARRVALCEGSSLSEANKVACAAAALLRTQLRGETAGT